MLSTWGIVRRELASYFNSPAAYIVMGFFLLMLGYSLFSRLFLDGLASMQPFFTTGSMLLVVFAPAITMRSIAEEKKTGTIEMLLTLPISDGKVVVGKFLAALILVMIGLLFTSMHLITVAKLAAPGMSMDLGPVAGGYIGLLLLAGAFLSIGMLASSLTSNQIVAFIIGLVSCFFLYFIDKLAIFLPLQWGSLLQYLSADYHFGNITRGVIDSRDVIYYICLIWIGLALTQRSLQAARA
ncbi:MAG: ABC transporter permease subunit [Myxococcota bacterium]